MHRFDGLSVAEQFLFVSTRDRTSQWEWMKKGGELLFVFQGFFLFGVPRVKRLCLAGFPIRCFFGEGMRGGEEEWGREGVGEWESGGFIDF